MSLFPLRRQQRHAESHVDGPLIPPRPGTTRGGLVAVTNDTAMRHSAVWACLQLRAGLISSFPLDVFRKVGDLQVEVPKPPVLVEPGGREWDYVDWMAASQVDMDRAGNTIGLITEKNALGLPSRIDLQVIGACSVIQRRGEPVPRYRIDGKEYTRDKVWHERQYVIAGLPVGLSPIAYAAWTLSEGLSIQRFVLDWFGGGGVPKARLKNKEKRVPPREAALIKERWQATVANGDLFVHGSDWEYNMLQAEQMGMEWLEGRRFALSDVSRFFQCPADLIDAAISAPGSITYQSALQRNLQFLIMQLEPAVSRREKNLSKLLPRPRFVKLNTDALLRMDPETRAKVMGERIKWRILTPSEARAKDNLPPLTSEQEAEFVRLFGPPKATPLPAARDAGWPWEQVSPLSVAPYQQHPDLSEVDR